MTRRYQSHDVQSERIKQILLDKTLPNWDDATMGRKGHDPPTRDELARIPWAGEGPDPLEDATAEPPAVETFRFTEGQRGRVTDVERRVFTVEILDGTPTAFGMYLLPRRFRIEPRLDAEGRRSRLPALDVEVAGGRPRCRAIVSREADLTGHLLRELPIESFIRTASWNLARTRSRRKVAPQTSTLEPIDRDRVERALKRRGPGVRLDPELLEQVAAVWKRADAMNENTTKAVSAALHCAESTANRWIARSRELGLIPPPRRGGRKGDS